MKKLSKTLCILITLALPAGCINEDMSDCPPPYNTELTFSYSGDRQEPAMFSRMIDGVTLVVFDRAGGERVLDKTVVKADLNRFQGTELYLPAGDYRIVCWGNAFDDTELLSGSLSESRVHAPAYGKGKKIATNDHLYYGECDITVPTTVNASGKVTGDIPFRSAHIDMRIYIKGVNGLSDPSAWPELVRYRKNMRTMLENVKKRMTPFHRSSMSAPSRNSPNNAGKRIGMDLRVLWLN